jgi:hypothetical protein
VYSNKPPVSQRSAAHGSEGLKKFGSLQPYYSEAGEPPHGRRCVCGFTPPAGVVASYDPTNRYVPADQSFAPTTGLFAIHWNRFAMDYRAQGRQ